jgi:hypothetical protein
VTVINDGWINVNIVEGGIEAIEVGEGCILTGQVDTTYI